MGVKNEVILIHEDRTGIITHRILFSAIKDNPMEWLQYYGIPNITSNELAMEYINNNSISL